MIQAKNYFEHIGAISTANFYFGDEKRTQYLYVLVLTSRKNDWLNENNEVIPTERYGDSLGEWQIYEREAIAGVLKEFHQQSTINLYVYFIDKNIIQNEDLTGEIEPLTKNFVLVLDAFSLHFAENQTFVNRTFNSKDNKKVGGCLIPFCGQYVERQRTYAKKKLQETFDYLAVAWDKEFYKAYTHIELDIPNKTHFFRRLANIAYHRGIEERETMARFEANSKRFVQPERP